MIKNEESKNSQWVFPPFTYIYSVCQAKVAGSMTSGSFCSLKSCDVATEIAMPSMAGLYRYQDMCHRRLMAIVFIPIFSFFILSLFVLPWVFTLTETSKLHADNVAAADQFIGEAEINWPGNPKPVISALKRMGQSYLSTGENSPEKLAQLARLSEWIKTASSSAEEQQLFLAEVRNYGRVIASIPASYYFVGDQVGIMVTAFVASILLGILFIATINIRAWLQKRKG